MSKHEKHVNFSQLTSSEKGKYIEFIQKNNIPFDANSDSNELLVRFKIKRPEKQQNNKENIMKPRQTTTSTLRISKVQKETQEAKQPKKIVENNAFVLASKKTASKPQIFENNFVSFSQSPVMETQSSSNHRKTLSQNTNIEDTRAKSNPRNIRGSLQESTNTNHSHEIDKRSTSVPNIHKKLHFEEVSMSPQRNEGRRSASSQKFENSIQDCFETYSEFVAISGIRDMARKTKPVKIVVDTIQRMIEEIYLAKFNRETAQLKSTLRTKREDASQKEDFPNFVYNYLREKNKTKSLLDQNAYFMIYSIFSYRTKHKQIELFSDFLCGTLDSEDLTFFLFIRSIAEREMNIFLHSRSSSTINTCLNPRYCFRILEAVYGRGEKSLITKVFKKIKDYINKEKERTLNYSNDKIYLYNFFDITLHDYRENRSSSNQYKHEQPNTKSTQNSQKYESVEDKTKYYLKEILETPKMIQEKTPTKAGEARQINNSLHASPLDDFSDEISFRETNDKFLTTGDETRFMEKNLLTNSQNLLSLSHNPLSTSHSNVFLSTITSKKSSLGMSTNFSVEKEMKENFLITQCLDIMMAKIDEFVSIMVFEGAEAATDEGIDLKNRMMQQFELKLRLLLKALFSLDKLRWLNVLGIDRPGLSHLQNIENLQKELRSLTKSKIEDMSQEKIEIFATKIFKTSEVANLVGKLVVEYTIPQE